MSENNEISEGDLILTSKLKYKILKLSDDEVKLKVYERRKQDDRPFIITFTGKNKFDQWLDNKDYTVRSSKFSKVYNQMKNIIN